MRARSTGPCVFGLLAPVVRRGVSRELGLGRRFRCDQPPTRYSGGKRLMPAAKLAPKSRAKAPAATTLETEVNAILGDSQPPRLPSQRRAQLPDARPLGLDALGWREPSASGSPRRSALSSHWRHLHPRRAFDWPAPARQRPAARRRSSACATSATR